MKENKLKNPLTVNRILWLIYLSLLAVLLPHTAWAFDQFEPVSAPRFILVGTSATFVAWTAAFAFEAAIAALTHKLAKRIEETPKGKKGTAKFIYQYVNEYSVGLVASIGVSSLANLAHAVEFGGDMLIFAEWSVPFGVYAVIFGAVLPLVSLTFARVLSNANETEGEDDPALVTANATISDLRRQLRDSEQQRKVAEQLRAEAEQKFAAAGELMARLFAEEKRQRVLAAKELWPQLSGNAIAVIAGSSPAYVSEVLSEVV